MIKLEANAIIAVDFDGTCLAHAEFPEIGADIGAVPWLKAWSSAGARIILWTVRGGDGLKPAVQWFKDNKIPLWGINENPEQSSWSKSPKAHAHLFVDELAFGAPLIHPKSGRPYLDWNQVGPAVLAALMKS